MEETSTHIHFPDSNRSNPSEKSNQVSLCGTLEGVEKARSLVRLSTPLLISFELIVLPMTAQPDRENPYVTMVEQKYNVQVIFSLRPKLHSSLVLVKGSERDSTQVKEATQTLINFYCGNLAVSSIHWIEICDLHSELLLSIFRIKYWYICKWRYHRSTMRLWRGRITLICSKSWIKLKQRWPLFSETWNLSLLYLIFCLCRWYIR